MKVYIVSEGEYGEGGVVSHACLVKEKALKHIPMNLSQDHNGEHTPGVWWKSGGVDYIEVQEVELECTLHDLERALEEKKVEAFMEKNVTEARIRTLVETLGCSRNKAVGILQENAK